MKMEREAQLARFAANAAFVRCERYGAGHINSTYLAAADNGKKYILQRINDHVFSDVQRLMENITAVTEHIRARTQDPRSAPAFIPTTDGKLWFRDAEGCWRMQEFEENTICLQRAETPEDFRESAVAFGRFQRLLSDFPAERLHETIPNFHNTPDRFRILEETVRRDPLGRVKNVLREIDYARSQKETVSQLQMLRDDGTLPVRVTHNDTKLNNVLFDASTRKAVCVIDLDTVMPGLSLYDFGDAIRFGAVRGAEDERDPDRVSFSSELFRVYTNGYLSACGKELTREELELLPLGALTITMECGVRFLTDYLDGDHYFATTRAEQNLDRARTQFKLYADMRKQEDTMHTAVKEELLL